MLEGGLEKAMGVGSAQLSVGNKVKAHHKHDVLGFAWKGLL
jgi:hypothetical protein